MMAQSDSPTVTKLHSARGQVVASVTPDGILHRRMSGRRHILRRAHAIAFERAVIRAALAADVVAFEVTDTDDGRVYTCSLDQFREHAFELEFGDYGEQLALKLKFWTVSDARQLALWGRDG